MISVYTFKATMTAAAGSASAATLKLKGGLLRHVVVRANTATTVFSANLQDDNNFTLMNWGYHTGEINDVITGIPITEETTFNITNASVSDTFNVRLSFEE